MNDGYGRRFELGRPPMIVHVILRKKYSSRSAFHNLEIADTYIALQKNAITHTNGTTAFLKCIIVAQ